MRGVEVAPIIGIRELSSEASVTYQTPSVASTKQSTGKGLSPPAGGAGAEPVPSLKDEQPLSSLELPDEDIGVVLCSPSGISLPPTAPRTESRSMHCTSGRWVTPANRNSGAEQRSGVVALSASYYSILPYRRCSLCDCQERKEKRVSHRMCGGADLPRTL
jgi:hypothetical protein